MRVPPCRPPSLGPRVCRARSTHAMPSEHVYTGAPQTRTKNDVNKKTRVRSDRVTQRRRPFCRCKARAGVCNAGDGRVLRNRAAPWSVREFRPVSDRIRFARFFFFYGRRGIFDAEVIGIRISYDLATVFFFNFFFSVFSGDVRRDFRVKKIHASTTNRDVCDFRRTGFRIFGSFFYCLFYKSFLVLF